MNKTLVFIAAIGFAFNVLAQDASEYVVTIDSGIGAFGPEEPSININRKNKKYIIVGTNINRLYISNDKGKTWKKKDIGSKYGIWGDPVVTSDKDGNFYFTHLSWPGLMKQEREQDSWLDRMVIQKSSDYGKTWPADNFVGLNEPKDQDKQWLHIDPETGRMHMSWTQFDKYNSPDTNDRSVAMYAYSDDGETWSKAQRISKKSGLCLDDSRTVEGVIPAAGTGNKVHTVWMLRDSIYYNASENDGDTWQTEKGIFPIAGWDFKIPGIDRTNGFPSFICEEKNGVDNLYMSWSDQTLGEDNTEIWNAYSTDGGKTWSKAKALSSTQFSKGHQFFSTMFQDPIKGTFYWLFYDRSQYSDNKTDIVLAWSDTFEGEKNFVKLNKKAFTPKEDIFFGDYIQVDAYKGMVRPVWTEFVDGNLAVKTALLDYKQLKKWAK